MSNAHAYRWIGTETIDGRPHRHLGNLDIAPADLAPDVVAALTPYQIERIEGEPDLYQSMSKAEYEEYTAPPAEPKWYEDLQAKAEEAGKVAPERLDKETKAAYLERVPAETFEADPPPADPIANPDPATTEQPTGEAPAE